MAKRLACTVTILFLLNAVAFANGPGQGDRNGRDDDRQEERNREEHDDQRSGDWTMAGQNLHNTRNQAAERKISAKNANTLAAKWVYTTKGDVSATATVEDGAVYVPDWGGYLHKINATTGQAIWSFPISKYNGIPNSISRTSPAIAGDLLIIGDQNGGHLMAINKYTGNLVWISQLDSHAGAIITSSPAVHGDRIYLGISSGEEGMAANPAYPCCSFRGSVVAVDLRTGALLWKTYTVPVGYSGGAVWGSTPVVDTMRSSLYVTTGNNYTVPADVAACIEQAGQQNALDCMAPDNYIDAVMALDLKTGTVKWAKRVEGPDAWTVACFLNPAGTNGCPSPAGPDFDFGSGPNLFSVKVNGQKRDLLGAGQKSGVYWAFDPDNGTTVWRTLVGPGGTLGGIQWGSATDGKRLYVAISNNDRKPYTLQPSGQATNGGSWSALDPATGQILWQTADPTGAIDPGYVTTANGVVYAGSMDPAGHMYGLDGATGSILWSFASGGSVISGAAVSNGTVFWGSGYTRFGLGTPNNKFYAFTLKGK